MLVVGIITLIFGFMFTFSPQAMLSIAYESFTGNNWNLFVTATPKTVDFLLLNGTIFGLHTLVMGILFVSIAILGFRSGQRWAWYTLLVAATLTCVSDAIIMWTLGLTPLVIGNVVFLSLAYIALGISAKPILSKK